MSPELGFNYEERALLAAAVEHTRRTWTQADAETQATLADISTQLMKAETVHVNVESTYALTYRR